MQQDLRSRGDGQQQPRGVGTRSAAALCTPKLWRMGRVRCTAEDASPRSGALPIGIRTNQIHVGAAQRAPSCVQHKPAAGWPAAAERHLLTRLAISGSDTITNCFGPKDSLKILP